MIARAENIFAALPEKLRHEHFLTLFETQAVRIERIVSRSHSSPAGFWYDQPHHEWIMLVRGQATLEFADGELVGFSETMITAERNSIFSIAAASLATENSALAKKALAPIPSLQP